MNIMEKNFKWQISNNCDISVSKNVLWAAISVPFKLEIIKTHPYLKSYNIITWNENDKVDELVYLNERKIIRTFSNWDEGNGYSLYTKDEGGKQTKVVWEISSIDSNKSNLKITLFMPYLQKYPLFVRWVPHFLFLRPKMKKYLYSVVNGFKHTILTGEPTKRNQFGKHRWFSQ